MTDWQAEALPVLQAAYRVRVTDPRPAHVPVNALNVELQREPDSSVTFQTLGDLLKDEYLEVVAGTWDGMNRSPYMLDISAKGLQRIAGWPSSATDAVYSALVDALGHAVNSTDDPVERSRLERIRVGLVELGRDAFHAAVSAAVEGAVRSVT
jgi:hypothetical protein